MADEPKLVDMARTPAEQKAAQDRYTADDKGPDYPWGLCINLCENELTKLGISGLPEVGDEMHIYAVAKVTSVSHSANERDDDSRNVSLQIVQMSTMEMDDADEDDTPAGKLYSKRT